MPPILDAEGIDFAATARRRARGGRGREIASQ